MQKKDERAAFLRRQAEENVQKKAMYMQENIEALSPGEIRRILHELQVHQIELDLQNEELRRIQAELEISQSRYFDLYDLAPVGYCTMNEKGFILEANLTAANLLKIARSMLVKLPLSRFILKEDQHIYYLHHKQLFETGNAHVCELRMKREDETEFWTRLEAVITQEAGGESICRIVMSDITRAKEAEEKVQTLLQGKELLLKEVHHRVKNNINSIASILSLQSRSISSPEAIAALQEAISRITSIRVLYDKLIITDDYRDVSVKQYLDDLIESSIALYPENSNITLEKQIAEFSLNSKLLFPVGIIVNELITNIMKYAFINRNTGIIRIDVIKADNHITLTVRDNGIGLPDEFDINQSKGLGLMLVKMLSLQLKGNLSIKNQHGVRCTIEFDI